MTVNSTTSPLLSPKISVIVPAFNAAPYLPECIESILNQTFPNFELIIVNDCSTDHTKEVIHPYLSQDDRITYIKHSTNCGASTSRNRALEVARGDYIALMDADDICRHDRFTKQLDYMTQHDLDVCGSYLEKFGAKSRIIKYPTDNVTIKLNLLCYGRTIANPSAMIRKSIIGPLRYNSAYCFAEDYDFWVNIALKVKSKFGNIAEPLLKYRKHPAQATQNLHHLNRSIVIESLNRALSSALTDLNPAIIELHYKVLRERHKLSATEWQSYGKFLLHLPRILSMSDIDLNNYWYSLCGNRLARNLNTWKLYGQLSGNQLTLPLANQVLMLIKSLLQPKKTYTT